MLESWSVLRNIKVTHAQQAGSPDSGGEAEVSLRQREVFTTAPSTKLWPCPVPCSLPVHNG